MLEDGRYELRIDTGQVYALGNPTNPLVDNDGTPDGRRHRRVPPVGGRLQRQWGSRRGRQDRLAAALRLQAGQSLYDYAYDLNGDGTIDLFDYVIWRKHARRTV